MELARDETLSQLQDRCGPLRYPRPLIAQQTFPLPSQMRRRVMGLFFLQKKKKTSAA